MEKATVMNALKWIVVIDWRKMEPMITFLNKEYKLKGNPWGNFEWLADETAKYLDQQGLGRGEQPVKSA